MTRVLPNHRLSGCILVFGRSLDCKSCEKHIKVSPACSPQNLAVHKEQPCYCSLQPPHLMDDFSRLVPLCCLAVHLEAPNLQHCSACDDEEMSAALACMAVQANEQSEHAVYLCTDRCSIPLPFAGLAWTAGISGMLWLSTVLCLSTGLAHLAAAAAPSGVLVTPASMSRVCCL